MDAATGHRYETLGTGFLASLVARTFAVRQRKNKKAGEQQAEVDLQKTRRLNEARVKTWRPLADGLADFANSVMWLPWG